MDYAGLEAFCSTDLAYPDLTRPWSQGRFTYATNGHVAVRVPRLPGIAERDAPPPLVPIFDKIAGHETALLPALKLPAPELANCFCRIGPGTVDGPAREDCEICHGTGTLRDPQTLALRGVAYAVEALELITPLPELGFDVAPQPNEPARFVFAGGEGAIMPLAIQTKFEDVVQADGSIVPYWAPLRDQAAADPASRDFKIDVEITRRHLVTIPVRARNQVEADELALSIYNHFASTEGLTHVPLGLPSAWNERELDAHEEIDRTFRCVDCGKDTSGGEYYSVKEEVWAAAGMAPHGGMLCLADLERRIGRWLTLDDFTAIVPRDWPRHVAARATE